MFFRPSKDILDEDKSEQKPEDLVTREDANDEPELLQCVASDAHVKVSTRITSLRFKFA